MSMPARRNTTSVLIVGRVSYVPGLPNWCFLKQTWRWLYEISMYQIHPKLFVESVDLNLPGQSIAED